MFILSADDLVLMFVWARVFMHVVVPIVAPERITELSEGDLLLLSNVSLAPLPFNAATFAHLPVWPVLELSCQ